MLIIADKLSKAGWSWGCISAVDCNGRTIWIVDAHRDTGKRFVVRSDERLAAFLELESVIRGCGNCLDKQADFFQTRRPQTDLRQRSFPRQVLRLLQTCNRRINTAGKTERELFMNPLIQLKQAAPVFFISLVCFGLLPTTQAVNPPPDGGYPGGNTAEGFAALFNLTTGAFNTAVGWASLFSDTTGQFNTGVGAGTLLANTGDENTATGVGALFSNVTGGTNTAAGAFALFSNTSGVANTADGNRALFSNISGNFNTANGESALTHNTVGNQNTAVGYLALFNNIDCTFNTAVGASALINNQTGLNNTA